MPYQYEEGVNGANSNGIVHSPEHRYSGAVGR
jgi:hypothetical protein